MKSYLIFLAGTVVGSAIAAYLIGWFLSATPEMKTSGAGSVSHTWTANSTPT